MSLLMESIQWEQLKADHERAKVYSLRALFDADPARKAKYVLTLDDLTFDFSRTHVTDVTLELLTRLAEARRLPELRGKMFRGDKINNTENRAVLHTALRAQKDDPILVDGKDVIPEIRAVQEHMASFVKQVRDGDWRGATGAPIKHIVNIGIGGSDLGPRTVVNALRFMATGPEVHFIANIDAGDRTAVLKGLDPASTLFVVVSKTFTTQETLMNAMAARRWIAAALGDEAVDKHFVAVSSNIEAVREFGIADANIFPMWDWVGGRFSLWSAVGLSIALAIGWRGFSELLAGAARMDDHFHLTPLERNIPALMGLIGVWYRNLWDTNAVAVLPYDERLRDFPRFLQQLEMESNGKSVSYEGTPLNYQTAPVVFGECGSVGQHSFHQYLHQGTQMIPADFIGIEQDDWKSEEQHRILLANLKAQAEALRVGMECPEASYKSNPGNKPSQILWLKKLTPYSLGLLLALYEHKTFVQGAVWGINSFDQWGVELGKKLVKELT